MSEKAPRRSKLIQWLLVAFFILLSATLVVEAVHELTSQTLGSNGSQVTKPLALYCPLPVWLHCG
jgi:hypothetical protein